VDGVLLDLLMAVMNSLQVWSAAARDRARGLKWRDAVTARMSQGAYRPYGEIVAEAAAEIGLPDGSRSELFESWKRMQPWPDAAALARLTLPYAFVTNSSTPLARIAAERSGLRPLFVLSAEEAGWYKPHRNVYREACRRLGSSPERIVFVAGSRYDAEGASAAGLQTWLVRRRPDQDIDEARIRVASSLEEVVESIHRGRPRW
jgi:2-haloalkanoic acid dehalogenase type II